MEEEVLLCESSAEMAMLPRDFYRHLWIFPQRMNANKGVI